MKRIALLLVFVAIIDLATGAVLNRLDRRVMSGERGGLTNYALTKDVDVLVLGSSRAQFQIMPSVLAGRLSLRAFNAGLKGHDFLYAAALYDLWTQRHAPPRAIVLTMDVESLLRRDSEIAAAQILGPYFDESDRVREVLYAGGPQKRLEYLFRSYRFNGKVLAIAKNLFVRPDTSFDGFVGKVGTLPPDTTRVLIRNALDQDASPMEYAMQPFWDLKVRYMRELGATAKRQHALLLLVHTPLYAQDVEAHRVWVDRMTELVAATPGVEFVDLCEVARPSSFTNENELFWDVNHLNARGAEILSGLLADELQKRLGRERRIDQNAESGE